MTDIFANVSTFIQNAIEQAQIISPMLAAGGAVLFGLMYAFGGQQAAQFAKSRGLQMIVGLIIVWSVSALVNTLIRLAGAGTTVDDISIGMGIMIDVFKVTYPQVASLVIPMV